MLFRYYLIIFAGKKMSVRILMALGSNHEQEKNVAFAMKRLHSFFPSISFSRMLWTEPIGIASDRFVNALALADTEKEQEELYPPVAAGDAMGILIISQTYREL